MGLLDKKLLDKAKGLGGKAKTFAEGHTDQLKAGVDKGVGMANKATKGKYKDKLAKAETKADEAIGKLHKK